MTRTTFEDVDPATIIAPSPLAVGLFGYGGSGKTESALRLAFGMQRVFGGEVYFADTENRKGLAYRRMFPFRYIEFGPPHNALRYIELIKIYSQKKGVLVIDQFTEEHDGEGGMLETHEDEKGGKEGKNAAAWAIAKRQHKKLPRELRKALTSIPIVGTWRAEDKTDWNNKDDNGKVKPIPIGQMPIGSKDIPFEMTATYLLRPGARGMPCLHPETRGEDIMTKIPRWFADIIRPGEVITEEHGEAMARWAKSGETSTGPTPDDLRSMLATAETVAAVKALAPMLTKMYPRGHADHAAWKAMYDAAMKRVSQRPPTEPPRDPLANMSPTATLPEERQPGDEG